MCILCERDKFEYDREYFIVLNSLSWMEETEREREGVGERERGEGGREGEIVRVCLSDK